ncbi:aminodeoxychorismate synthase, component I [Psychromonas sp. psych-6C06]|uniref:aminodeoxychorismate synthase component I n=1 Tax=Psychromonas sp. psych-6C06 TaxID=2058089 RepID=UPI000C31DE0F|nr:aminodeoxychorismate synthase component I [Psychromonas sp. psych-6C06]PKF63835.1 aminodeoxychorismate synthase, component I [Psychromonas sp. psych-6C06]
MTNCPTNIQIRPISLTMTQFERLKSALSKHTWSVFLESADSSHVDSKWSIVSALPVATLQSTSGSFTYQQGEFVKQENEDPFAFIHQQRMQLFPIAQTQHNIPFIGGVLGAIDYELGYQFEKIDNATTPNSLSLPELSVGFYDWALLYDHKNDQFQLVSHHCTLSTFNSNNHWQDRYNWLMKQITFQENTNPFQLTSNWQSNMDIKQYRDKFAKVQAYILSGDCYQVNLAQRFNANYQGDEYLAYKKLLSQNKPPFAAFVRLPEQVILSLSPERFLKFNDGTVESKPIKGTRPRYKEKDKDLISQNALQHSEKDRSENLMIVDLLRNDIGRVCIPGSVKVPALFEIESFPAVHHLVSTVIGKLNSKFNVEDLLRVSFPGGSITGAPKIRAMEIIAELEPDSRHSYCGSIGYISADGTMDMNIAIRTLICVEGKIYCAAGGGLVADSKADDEYQECLDKVSKILPCLNDELS